MPQVKKMPRKITMASPLNPSFFHLLYTSNLEVKAFIDIIFLHVNLRSEKEDEDTLNNISW